MRRLLAGFALVGIWTAGLAQAGSAQRVAGYRFSLAERDGRCIVRFHGPEHAGRLTLAPSPPCRFVADEGGALRHFAYEDVGVDAVLIVTGTPATEAERTTWNLPEGLFCGSVAQGVLASERGVVVSKETMQDGIVCATTGVDEKRFWQFAHP